VLLEKGGGAAKVDLTHRKWEIWIRSAGLRQRLKAFNQQLRSGAYTRLITADAALMIATIPVWSSFLVSIAWSLSSSKARHEVWSGKTSSNIQWPNSVTSFEYSMVKLWLVFLIIALGIGAIRLMGGGLGIWPEYLSQHSFQKAIYEIRSNFALPRNINAPLFVSVAGAIVGAIVTLLLTRYLG
jgi:hypothetical protein